MQPLKAQVRNGRLVLDTPTSRPEGEIVELVELQDILTLNASEHPPLLTADDEAGLHAALNSLRDGNGRTRDQVQQTIDAILRR
jgi:hypothetical protein